VPNSHASSQNVDPSSFSLRGASIGSRWAQQLPSGAPTVDRGVDVEVGEVDERARPRRIIRPLAGERAGTDPTAVILHIPQTPYRRRPDRRITPIDGS
jgi:hypothetical protein